MHSLSSPAFICLCGAVISPLWLFHPLWNTHKSPSIWESLMDFHIFLIHLPFFVINSFPPDYSVSLFASWMFSCTNHCFLLTVGYVSAVWATSTHDGCKLLAASGLSVLWSTEDMQFGAGNVQHSSRARSCQRPGLGSVLTGTQSHIALT